MTKVLELNSVTKNFEDVKAVDGISLKAEAGDFITIEGASGCGKSILLMLVGSLLQCDTGTITINDKEISAMNISERTDFRADNIGFIFQQFHLMPYLNIKENILTANLSGQPVPEERADELLKKFGLEHRTSHLPAELSVGEQQRVAAARAFLKKPKLILADEPTGALDPENTKIILDTLKEYAEEGNCVIMVSHDPEAIKAGNKRIKINNGKIISE